MSAAGIIEGIALIGVVITTVPVLSDLFNPKPDKSTTTKVRLVAGDGDFTEGNIPHVALFDRSGSSIGFSDVGKNGFKSSILSKGQPHDLSITQEDTDSAANGAEYLSMTASGNNAVCISIVTVTTPSGVQYSWMGDVAKQCGAPWSYGNVVASISTKGEVRPACIWLDLDATNGLKTKGVGMHLPSFQSNELREADFRNHTDKMCKSDPRFKVYEELTSLDPIPYFVEPVYNFTSLLDFGNQALNKTNWDTKPIPDEFLDMFGKKKRETQAARIEETKRPAHLVVTSFGAHSARELCESSSSWGPDLVNPEEGYYCDMESKTLWAVCDKDGEGNKKAGCFDMNTNRLRLGGKWRLGRREGKKYTHVKRWT
ncbi:hypothetical protein V8F33_013645 [Rhypophila sp. PSN 637]